MSNYWDLRCVTCSTPQEAVKARIDMNRGQDQLVPLLRVQAEATALGVAMRERAKDAWGQELELPRWVGFFAAHAGHEVKVFSEYGYAHDQCDRNVDCEGCGHRRNCVLKENHDGPCSWKEASP